MPFKKRKEYYLISKKQYNEMKDFYIKLGYTDKQSKKLAEKCFGAEIKIDKNVPYIYNWTFRRNIEYEKNSFKGSGMFLRNAAPMGMARACAAIPAEEFCDEECCDMEFAAPPMNMNAAMPGAAAPMQRSAPLSFSETPRFSTAETHDVPENEVNSPMDKPQLIFSANVNTASWSYLRSKIVRNMPIDKSFVRIEEILNSYRYKLKKPENDELFSVSTETADCPWNDDAKLLFVGIKGKKSSRKVRQNLALLVDVSGSMEDEWVLVQMSMAAIISKLKEGDTLSIIAYSDTTVTVVKQLDCGDKEKCVEAILSVDGIGGCTNGSEGLENAYDYLAEHYDKDGNNRVFIFTDGDFNFGLTSEGSLKDFIDKKRETGIYLSIVGYGERNFKDNKMETLARNGNGNYTFVSNPYDILDNLWKKLVSNLVTIAKNVKILVELNPAYVSEYRLIGYDARMLTQEEFHDTKKAVDGIGSGHNAVALIEYKSGEAKQKYGARYVTAKKEENPQELGFIEIHCQSPDGEDLVFTKAITLGDLDSASPNNIRKASALALFGLLVKDSEYKGKADRSLLGAMIKELSYKEDDTENSYSHFSIIKKYLDN